MVLTSREAVVCRRVSIPADVDKSVGTITVARWCVVRITSDRASSADSRLAQRTTSYPS